MDKISLGEHDAPVEARNPFDVVLEQLEQLRALAAGGARHDTAVQTLSQVDRVAGGVANLILVLKEADKRHARREERLANRELQQQADTNHIRDVLSELAAQVSRVERNFAHIVDRPEVVAALVPKPTIDAARQIARRSEIIAGEQGAAAVSMNHHDDTGIFFIFEGRKRKVPYKVALLTAGMIGILAVLLIEHFPWLLNLVK